MKRAIIYFLAITMLAACTPKPQPINYGEDLCHFCKMTIVDDQHAAEVVTSKGKVFKFDAIECMINYRDQNPDEQHPIKLVCDYSQPGELADADAATYLISEKIPSPMGANLSAFAERENAEQMQNEKGGRLYSWAEIQLEISNR